MNKTQRINRWRAIGPGMVMASAAVGASHLVASTQSGALFGWQLLWLIVLVNVLKYPFFCFGVQYTLINNKSLIEGYQQKGQGWLIAFTLLNLIAAVVNTAGSVTADRQPVAVLYTWEPQSYRPVPDAARSLPEYFACWALSGTRRIITLADASADCLHVCGAVYRLAQRTHGTSRFC